MLRKIRLKNFESHEDSEMEFTDGFNLIVGQSNQGKSSIVRAISLVVANRFDKDSVRTGADFCEVEIESDKGSVTVQRGESINKWFIKYANGDKKEYKNVGTSVPPDVIDILGMGERSHGEIKELPNIMFQFEKHYMISEIDGKKTTSNMIARMMDEAIGIGGMEELIKDIANDFQSFKKDLNTCTSDISILKSEIMDESIFNDRKDKIDKIRSKYSSVEEIEGLLKDSEDFSSRISNIENRSKIISKRIEKLSKIESLFSKLKRTLDEYNSIKKAIGLINLIDRSKKSILQIERVIKLNEKATEDLRKIKLLSTQKKLSDKIASIESSSFDCDNLVDSINSMQEKKKNIESAESSLYNARLLYRRIMKLNSSIKDSINKLKESEDDLHALRDKLGTCPLCGSTLH